MAERYIISDKSCDRMSVNYQLLIKTFIGKELITSIFIETNVGMNVNYFKCIQAASYFVLSRTSFVGVRTDYLVSRFYFSYC